ncbi:hypothetical protein BDM02DRAFT_3131034 [Thelephora ganbajun]|uniref:Uncharacterized protein n=1 Tax=Thelephora ganbajun TaxID=370292 RepID=A0ACB6Z764_THEGA|nr:hypothetical protein BDM02DRAFT_3131034 [Thelephora ganbajun]
MRWFKKSKKSRQPSQHPIPLGTSTLGINPDPAPDIGSEGVSNEGGSRVASRDRSEGRQPHASGASTPIRGCEDGVTLLRKREDEREAPLNASSEKFSHSTPDLSSAERPSEVQNRVECKERRTVTEQPPETPLERILGDDHTVQPGGPGVVERDGKDTALEAAAIRVDVPKGPAQGFGSLRAVLGTIPAVYTDHKKTAAVENKIEDLLSRIEVLEARFATPPGSVVEQRHRSELIRKFGHIEGQLQSPSEKFELRRLDEHVQDDKDVSGLLEDLREIISAYQMAQQMEMYKHTCKLIRAEYRHGDRRGCFKGTRTAVLDQIEHWARDSDKPPVYWLNGLAGTGKSTIAQTIAERIFADGQLGASFFCSRDFEDRRDLHFIFPTIAAQLARKYAEFRSIFVPLVQSDPAIVDESLYNQMKKLIVEPLEESAISTVIVIDALDECKDEEPASAILTVLGQFVSEIPKLGVLTTALTLKMDEKGVNISLLTYSNPFAALRA